MSQLFSSIYHIGVHESFGGKGAKKLVERITLDYLTYEFVTGNNNQLIEYNRRQQEALS